MSKMSGHGQISAARDLIKPGSERTEENELRLDDASSDDDSRSSSFNSQSGKSTKVKSGISSKKAVIHAAEELKLSDNEEESEE